MFMVFLKKYFRAVCAMQITLGVIKVSIVFMIGGLFLHNVDLDWPVTVLIFEISNVEALNYFKGK